MVCLFPCVNVLVSLKSTLLSKALPTLWAAERFLSFRVDNFWGLPLGGVCAGRISSLRLTIRACSRHQAATEHYSHVKQKIGGKKWCPVSCSVLVQPAEVLEHILHHKRNNLFTLLNLHQIFNATLLFRTFHWRLVMHSDIMWSTFHIHLNVYQMRTVKFLIYRNRSFETKHHCNNTLGIKYKYHTFWSPNLLLLHLLPVVHKQYSTQGIDYIMMMMMISYSASYW